VSADLPLAPPRGAITFAHRGAFWFGVTACAAGVILHLPMYWGPARWAFRWWA
jgi:hypothetical protein